MNRSSNAKFMLGVVFCVTIAAVPSWATAQTSGSEFPKKPVRLVVSVTPGGGTDTLARILGPKLTERWGHAIVVENRPGASGLISMENIAASAPDGHSLVLFNASHLLTAQQTGKLSFERGRDFTPIALPASTEFVLVVYPGLAVKSLQDFIALAKSKPNSLNYVTSGIGSIPHLANELLAHKAGIKLTHVPYQGAGGAALTDLLSGRVQVYLLSQAGAAGYVKSGRLVALAVSGAQRSQVLPEVPTFEEGGISDFDISSWWGVFGPGKMPAALVAKLNADFNWAVQQRDAAKQLSDAGLERHGTRSASQVDNYIANEIVKWNEALKVVGLR